MRFSHRALTFLAAIFAVFTIAGCGKDTAGDVACTFDSECPLGRVCQQQDKVCIEAACEFCTADQICYKPTPDSPGTCSAPECSTDDDCSEGSCRNGVCSTGGCVSNDDCGDGEICNIVGQCEASDGTCAGDDDCPSGQVCKDDACVAGCSSNDECEAGEYCTAESTCAAGCRDSMECPSGQICTDGACSCDATSCPEGKVCLDTGNCGNPTDCSQIDCGAQVCDPATLTCVDACTADSCMANEVCNTATGQCEVNNCPGEDPNQCAGNAQRPLWDPIKCFCAECTDDSQCDTAAGETCNNAGICFACQTACDPTTGSTTCGGGTPYCIDNCCVECVGAADCAAGELCLDGFCGAPPNCQVDPTVCPAGYTCGPTGQCEAPMTGGSCDPNTGAGCPTGTFCDPTTGSCQGAGGGFGCGLCNPDCTCDNGMTCNGFLCDGCSVEEQLLHEIGLGPAPCGDGYVCFPYDPVNAPTGDAFCFPTG